MSVGVNLVYYLDLRSCSSRSLLITLAQASLISHSVSVESKSLIGSVPNSSPSLAAEMTRGSSTSSSKTPS